VGPAVSVLTKLSQNARVTVGIPNSLSLFTVQLFGGLDDD